MKKQETNMTEGKIWIQILSFSIPLLIGNLFQQLYNTVDSIIVGNYVGKEALAAVGSSGSLINLLIGMLVGVSTGSGILIAQYYGAGKAEKLQRAVHTAAALSVIGGILMTFLGFFASGLLLKLMGTPAEVMPSSTVYLQIFFLGSLFNLVYNMCAGILRAVGDSKTPLYYLIIASIVNIVLDIIFVVVFQLGVAGVAYATITAQGVSSVLIVRKLMRSTGDYRLTLKKVRIDRHMASRIIGLGLPSGIQSSIISLSNVVVQSNINSFGDIVMAGCGSYSKIDGFIMLPIMSFSMSAMTFVGQNVGAEKYSRARKGMLVTCAIGAAYVGAATIFLYTFGNKLIGIFTGEPEVIRYGMLMLSILLPFYLLIALSHIICGAFRGAGRAMVSMLILVVNLCVFRMLWVNIMVQFYPSIGTVLWGYPVTWITAFICCTLYAWKGKWLRKKGD